MLDSGPRRRSTRERLSAAAMYPPTLTVRATQIRVILGTAANMAPEQAR